MPQFNKILLILMLLLPSVVLGSDQQVRPFLGVGVSQFDVDFTGIPESQTQVPVYKLGVQLPSSRFYADWSFHYWPEAETIIIRASYDRLFTLGPRLQLFAGINGSLADFHLDSSHQQEEFDTGPGLGVQAGLLVQLADYWYLEAGGRYSHYWLETSSELVDPVELNATYETFATLMFVY
ncbi:hypothetical protein SAMN05660443_2397 [Marinospirillum celere]|uniref:Outer membrane protein beta-barrel domain-containing protein n=1 Tax=Marinospirillum celere TaxID=1122252 RepID=A0A1I1IM41_9GAMM|nr:hypothetical protein [Marinospirillum celere]SFC37287.1 hypothetical protein SAMN05660443_2397 [Marinospirillum celere]